MFSEMLKTVVGTAVCVVTGMVTYRAVSAAEAAIANRLAARAARAAEEEEEGEEELPPPPKKKTARKR